MSRKSSLQAIPTMPFRDFNWEVEPCQKEGTGGTACGMPTIFAVAVGLKTCDLRLRTPALNQHQPFVEVHGMEQQPHPPVSKLTPALLGQLGAS